jgi:low temperature requirement protein LtrA
MARLKAAPPQLRTLTDAESRHASALELFFDLVLAVAIASLGSMLSRDPSFVGFVRFAALFVPVWWAWVGYTFYADRFESDDLIYRLLVLVAMLAIAGVAVNTVDAFSNSSVSATLALSYVVVRVILLLLYARAYRHEPRARPLCGRYLVGFSIGAALWLTSVAIAPPGRYVLWGAGLGVELATPLLSSSAIARVPYHTSHIPERLGSFTIVVLGEAVVLTASGVGSRLHLGGGLIAAIGFGIAACLWWTYFEFVDDSPLRRGLLAGQTYVYGHLLVFAAITATGAGVLLAVRTGNTGVLSAGERAALCGGPALFLGAIGVIHLVNVRRMRDPTSWARLAAAAGIAVLGLLSGAFSPLAVAGSLLALLIVHAAVETVRRGSAAGMARSAALGGTTPRSSASYRRP